MRSGFWTSCCACEETSATATSWNGSSTTAFSLPVPPAGRSAISRLLRPTGSVRSRHLLLPQQLPAGGRRSPLLPYYQSADGLAINLYSASTAELRLPGGESIRVRQQTDYPDSGDVKIVLSRFKSRDFCLHLRIPRWCSAPEILVNGTPVPSAGEGGSACSIQRHWSPGDTVKLHFPMRTRWVRGTQQQAGRIALLHGPLLYGLNPARNPAAEHLDLRAITLDPHSVSGPRRGDAVRPGGTSFRVKGWSTPAALRGDPDLALTLTEFADFGDQEVFYQSSEPAAGGPDDLLGRQSYLTRNP